MVAVVWGIKALTTTAATVEMALHKKKIQTAEFVRDWHKHSTELWTKQNKIDGEIMNKLVELRRAVILLGDQLKFLKEQIKLK